MSVEFEKLVVLMEASVAKFDKDIQNVAKAVDTQMRTIETRTSAMSTRVEGNFARIGNSLRGFLLRSTGLGGITSEFAALGAVAGGPLTIGLAAATAAMGLWVTKTESGKKAAEDFNKAIDNIAKSIARDVTQGGGDILTRETTRPGFGALQLQRAFPLDEAAMSRNAKAQEEINAATVQFHKDANAAIDKADQDAAEKRQQAIDEASKKAIDARKKAGQEELSALEEIHTKIAQFEASAAEEELEARREISDKIVAFERQAAEDELEAWKEIQDKIAEAQALVSNEKFDKAVESVNSLRDAFDITGAAGVRAFDNIGDAFEQMLQQISARVFQMGVMNPILDALFGKKNEPGGLLGGIIGKLSGSLFGFAEGGSPPVGRASIVGERGPELFVPRVPGVILPAGMGIGGEPIQVVVSVRPSGEFDARVANTSHKVAVSVVGQYDRVLPTRVNQIANDPLRR